MIEQTEKTEQSQKTKNKLQMTADFQLILHTGPGKSLIDGTWHYGNMGLAQFSHLTSNLWDAYFRQNDPYAEWILLKISKAIETLTEALITQEAVLEKQMQSLRGFEITLFTNPNPIKQKFSFRHPLIFKAAALIERIDYLSRQILTLKRMGFVPEGSALSHPLKQQMRDIFKMSMEWKYTKVTREDIAENNAIAQNAEMKMGKLPEEILKQKSALNFLSDTNTKTNIKS